MRRAGAVAVLVVAACAGAGDDAAGVMGEAVRDAGRALQDAGAAVIDAGGALVDAGTDAASAQPIPITGDCTYVRKQITRSGSVLSEQRTFYAVMSAGREGVVGSLICDRQDLTVAPSPPPAPCEGAACTQFSSTIENELPTSECTTGGVSFASGKAYVWCGFLTITTITEATTGVVTRREDGYTFRRALLLR